MRGAGPLAERALALGLLLAVLYGIVALVALPIAARVRDLDAAIEHDRALILRLSRNITDRAALEAREAELRGWIGRSGIYLTGGTESLAAAEMQQQLKTTIERSGGTLRSLHNLPAERDGALGLIGLHVMVGATHDELVQMLHEIETSRPFLFIRSFSIEAGNSRRRARASGGEDAFFVAFDVYGVMIPETGS